MAIFKRSVINCGYSAPYMCHAMGLSNLIGSHHVQYHGIMTHFMAKHMVEDDEMLKISPDLKGLKRT